MNVSHDVGTRERGGGGGGKYEAACQIFRYLWWPFVELRVSSVVLSFVAPCIPFVELCVSAVVLPFVTSCMACCFRAHHVPGSCM